MRTLFLRMPKGILLWLLLAVNVINVNAQSKSPSSKPSAFDVGSTSLAFSLGVGSNYSYDYYDYYYDEIPNGTPTFAISLDRGIAKAGPGTIGIGGIIGIRSSTYRYDEKYKATYRNVIIGVRGTYHLTILKDKNNKFDPYGGVTLGLRLYNYKDNYYEERFARQVAIAGFFVGARYSFLKSLGAFAEVGYDVSVLRFGLNLNFH